MRYRAFKGCPQIYTDGSSKAAGYVHSGHDFRHDSAKLMQASLALAAPKIQMRYRTFKSCPQKAAELLVQMR